MQRDVGIWERAWTNESVCVCVCVCIMYILSDCDRCAFRANLVIMACRSVLGRMGTREV